jgi:uncharacterized protein (TIGR02284 family)
MAQAETTVLNDLIETLKDGELGFTTAADDAKSPELKALFLEYALQRSEFAAKLQRQVEEMGEKAEDSGSLAGDLHRGWIELKSAVSVREDLAVLQECERGEDTAVKAYSDALAAENLGTARPIVEQQFAQIKAAHQQVKILRDSLQPPEPPNAGETVLI